MAEKDNDDGLSDRAKVVVARIAAGAEGFQSAVAARGLDIAHNGDVVLFVVRGVVNSKHIPADLEVEVATAILTAVFVAAGGGPMTPVAQSAIESAVIGMREIIRAYKPSWWSNHWRARG
jgi:hypothetical protein